MVEFEEMKIYLAQARVRMENDDAYIPHPLIRALILATNEAGRGLRNKNYIGLAGDTDQSSGIPQNYFGVVVLNKGEDFEILAVEDVLNRKPLNPAFVVNILEISMRLDEYPSDEVWMDDAIHILNSVPYPQILFETIPPEKVVEATTYFLEQYINQRIKIKLPKRFQKRIRDLQDSEITIEDWRRLPAEIRSVIAMTWAQQIHSVLPPAVVTSPDDYMDKARLLDTFDIISEKYDIKFLSTNRNRSQSRRRKRPKKRKREKFSVKNKKTRSRK